MLIGMFVGIFVTVAGLTLSPPAPPPSPSPVAARARRPAGPRRHVERALPAGRALPTERASPVEPALPAGPGDIYSLRARRRFAAYLRLRLLEMRKAGLERAADVVEHRLPVDKLFGR